MEIGVGVLDVVFCLRACLEEGGIGLGWRGGLWYWLCLWLLQDCGVDAVENGCGLRG